MSNALVVIVLSLLPPVVDQPRDVRSVIQTADRMIEVSEPNPDLWKGDEVVRLDALGAWYRALPKERREAYDEVRRAVRSSRCFDRPVRLVMTTPVVKSGDDGGLVLEGKLTGRVEAVEDYYTRDQKDRIAEIMRAIRDKQNRHNHDMVRLEDNTPYKAERIQRFHEAIAEMGRAVPELQEKFDVEAEKRKVDGETVVVRVMVTADQAASVDRGRLGELNDVEVFMNVADFHIRPPLTEFDRPAALGSLEGKAVKLGGISYRASAATRGAVQEMKTDARPADEAHEPPK